MSRRITWFPAGVDSLAPDGTEIVLDGDPTSPFSELVGASGFGAADWSATWITTPGVDGATLSDVSTGAGEVTWRFLLSTDTHEEFVSAYRRLVRATNPKRGLGTFRVEEAISTDHGAVRQVRALCVGGLRGDALLARDSEVTEWPFDLVMQTPDPYWYSPDPLRATWTGFAPSAFFPFSFPFRLSQSGVMEADVLEVRGDADTWPTFELYGPFSQVRVRPDSDSFQTFWEITRDVGQYEMLRLVTAPNEESLTAWETVPGGSFYTPAAEPNAWGSLHSDSWFEPLRYDDSPERTLDKLVVDVVGTTADTRVVLSAAEAWLTAP